ncbi:MAG: phytanoyl-CoA hydroxylase [Verrucomicrobiales bacterium]|jgi:phytanoyl-CoA hydroxylase
MDVPLNAFRHDGFVRIPSFLATDEVADFRATLDQFIEDRVSELPRDAVFYEDREDPSSLKQIQHLEEHSLEIRTWFEGRFLDLANALLGEAVGKNFQYFNKPPDGKATPPHQDGFYFMLNPCEAVTMWLALEDVDEENGCLRYVRRSHLNGMRPHGRTETLGFSQGLTDFPNSSDIENEVICPAKAGDLFAHHALTVHRADANLSTTRSRRAVGAVFFSANARVDTEAQAAYREKLTREMTSAGKL